MNDQAFTATTDAVQVTVEPFFLEDQSVPEERKFLWAYRVTIANCSTTAIQLLRRTWHITDGHGRTIDVEGAGVVGELPVLEPGESFVYTSGTPLETPTGFMRGYYHMVRGATGETFDVEIPAFSLDSPFAGNMLH